MNEAEKLMADLDPHSKVLLIMARAYRAMRKGHFGPAAMACLLEIARDPECTSTSLAKYIGFSASAVVGSLDALEKHGYIERVAHADRRRRAMVVTEKGKELISRLTEVIDDKENNHGLLRLDKQEQ